MSEEHAPQLADKSGNKPTLAVYFVDMFELLAAAEEQPCTGLNGGYTVRLFHELMDALPSSHRHWNMQFQVPPMCYYESLSRFLDVFAIGCSCGRISRSVLASGK